MGRSWRFCADQQAQSPSDQENAEALGRLREAGLLGSVLISQDIFIKIQLVRYGGTGYAHILDHFVPRLRRHGFTEQDIQMLLIDNPRRVFSGENQGASSPLPAPTGEGVRG